jgi:uncharacterized membrane protein
MTEEEQKSAVVSLGVAGAVFGTFGLIGAGLFVRQGLTMQGTVFGAAIVSSMLTMVFMLWYRCWPDNRAGVSILAVPFGLRIPFLFTLGYGVTWVAHMLPILPTFNKAYVAEVGSLNRISVLISVVLAHYVFKEKDYSKRLWAALFIVLGAILISYDGLPARLSERFIGFGF